VQQLHAEHYPHLFKPPQPADFAAAFFAEILSNPAVTIYIAANGTEALGYIFCRWGFQPGGACLL